MSSDFWFDMGLSIVFSVLRTLPNNSQFKSQAKKAMLKLHNAIKIVYADDPDFQ